MKGRNVRRRRGGGKRKLQVHPVSISSGEIGRRGPQEGLALPRVGQETRAGQ